MKYEIEELYDDSPRDKKDRKWYPLYKIIPIEDLPDYISEFIRGATNFTKIWLRKGMSYSERIHVLAHEIAHIKNPLIPDEQLIDELAYAHVPTATEILREEKRYVSL